MPAFRASHDVIICPPVRPAGGGGWCRRLLHEETEPMRTASMLTAIAGSAITCAAYAQSIYNNGPIATGPLMTSGAPAPAGYQWSEMSNDNGTLGFTALRYTDDVTLATSTQVASVDVFSYLSSAGTTTSPFTSATLRIW